MHLRGHTARCIKLALDGSLARTPRSILRISPHSHLPIATQFSSTPNTDKISGTSRPPVASKHPQVPTAVVLETAPGDDPFGCSSLGIAGYDLFELANGGWSPSDLLYLHLRGCLPDAQQSDFFRLLLMIFGQLGPRHPASRVAMVAGGARSNPENLLPISLMAAAGEDDGAKEVQTLMRAFTQADDVERSEVALRPLHAYLTRRPLSSPLDLPPLADFFQSPADPLAIKRLRAIAKHAAAGSALQWLMAADSQLGNQETSDINDTISNCRLKSKTSVSVRSSGVFAAALLDLGFSWKCGPGVFQVAVTPGLLGLAVERFTRPKEDLPNLISHPTLYTIQSTPPAPVPDQAASRAPLSMEEKVALQGRIVTHKGGLVISDKDVTVYTQNRVDLLRDLVARRGWNWHQVLLHNLTGREYDRNLSDFMCDLMLATSYADASIWCNTIAAFVGSSRGNVVCALSAGLLSSDSMLFGPGAVPRTADFAQRARSRQLAGWSVEAIVEAEPKKNGAPIISGWNRPAASVQHDERIPICDADRAARGIPMGPHLQLGFDIGAYLLRRYQKNMNAGGYQVSFYLDQGFTPEQAQCMMSFQTLSGQLACYSEWKLKTPKSFYLWSTEQMRYDGPHSRPTPKKQESEGDLI